MVPESKPKCPLLDKNNTFLHVHKCASAEINAIIQFHNHKCLIFASSNGWSGKCYALYAQGGGRPISDPNRDVFLALLSKLEDFYTQDCLRYYTEDGVQLPETEGYLIYP